MSENVFNLAQIGVQSGTYDSPGSAVAAIVKFPVERVITPELDRASTIPRQDRGRNVRNSAGAGYHGVRLAKASVEAEVRFEDFCDILEQIYGAAALSGSNPYTRVYSFEPDTPTVIPYTWQFANTDDSVTPMRLSSVLIDQLTFGFADLTAPGAYPWRFTADLLGFDRDVNAITSSLSSRPSLETVQGHLATLAEGTTGTAFASLSTLSSSMKSFTMTAMRHLVGRVYAGSDKATSWGYSEQSNATFGCKVKISSTVKSDFLDIWNVASPAALGERRWRITTNGNSSRSMVIDLRAAIMAMPIDDVDGERVFNVTGECVDDSTLDASHQITIINGIADLTP